MHVRHGRDPRTGLVTVALAALGRGACRDTGEPVRQDGTPLPLPVRALKREIVAAERGIREWAARRAAGPASGEDGAPGLRRGLGR